MPANSQHPTAQTRLAWQAIPRRLQPARFPHRHQQSPRRPTTPGPSKAHAAQTTGGVQGSQAQAAHCHEARRAPATSTGTQEYILVDVHLLCHRKLKLQASWPQQQAPQWPTSHPLSRPHRLRRFPLRIRCLRLHPRLLWRWWRPLRGLPTTIKTRRRTPWMRPAATTTLTTMGCLGGWTCWQHGRHRHTLPNGPPDVPRITGEEGGPRSACPPHQQLPRPAPPSNPQAPHHPLRRRAPPPTPMQLSAWHHSRSQRQRPTPCRFPWLVRSLAPRPLSRPAIGVQHVRLPAQASLTGSSTSRWAGLVVTNTSSGVLMYADQSRSQGRRHLKAAGGTLASPSLAAPSLASPSPAPGARCYVGPGGSYAPYCTQIITPELNETVTGLLDKLTMWQQRTRERDPHNAKAKRRYVAGLRYV